MDDPRTDDGRYNSGSSPGKRYLCYEDPGGGNRHGRKKFSVCSHLPYVDAMAVGMKTTDEVDRTWPGWRDGMAGVRG